MAFRIDPILEPIGFGFAASLGRYLEVRRRYPEAAMIMGAGNLTELTDVDSAGVNTILLGFCQELTIQSVLTTAVINWARSSVRELDLARRLVHHAVAHHTLPKHLEPRLVALRDPKVAEFGADNLAELQRRIRDPNWRIFAEGGMIHALNNARSAPAIPIRSCSSSRWGSSDAAHAFYLGYELMKAKTALTLSKTYRQDQAMDWGFLTEPEVSHLARQQEREPPRSARIRAHAGRRRGPRGQRRGTRVILEGIVTTLNHDGALNIAPMGPEVDPGLSMARFVLRPFRTSTTYHNLKARRRGCVPRHRRRAAPGPDGHRHGPTRRCPRRGRRTSSRAGSWSTPAATTSFASSSSTTVKSGQRSSSRPSPRDDSATFSGSTGPSMRCSRRPSWRRARPGCPLTRCSSSFASSRSWSTRPADPRSARPSLSCTGMSARPPRSMVSTRTRAIRPHDEPSPCASGRRAACTSACWAGARRPLASSAASA